MYYKTPSLCARIAFRFFLCALINFAATQATVKVAANTLHNRNGIHLISSSIARSSSVSCSRSAVSSSVRSRISSSSRFIRAFFSVCKSSKSHRVFLWRLYQKLQKTLFCEDDEDTGPPENIIFAETVKPPWWKASHNSRSSPSWINSAVRFVNVVLPRVRLK